MTSSTTTSAFTSTWIPRKLSVFDLAWLCVCEHSCAFASYLSERPSRTWLSRSPASSTGLVSCSGSGRVVEFMISSLIVGLDCLGDDVVDDDVGVHVDLDAEDVERVGPRLALRAGAQLRLGVIPAGQAVAHLSVEVARQQYWLGELERQGQAGGSHSRSPF